LLVDFYKLPWIPGNKNICVVEDKPKGKDQKMTEEKSAKEAHVQAESNSVTSD